MKIIKNREPNGNSVIATYNDWNKKSTKEAQQKPWGARKENQWV